jgi:glycosyltransferase involved in cell wall biosynthesis
VFILLSVIFFFLILRFAVSLFNFISDPKLRRTAMHHHQLVSILIPARNEAGNILTLLQSIARQDYQDYEVIVLDDDSADDTFNVCQQFAQQHPHFRVIKGQPLQEGWLGKNYACHQLAQHAGGQYLLFLDADEQIENGLINSAVHRMQMRKLSLLSLFTNQDMRTWGEHAVVPLMHFILLNLLPLQLVYLVKNASVAAASGQFMLFDADLYRRYQWHSRVRDKVVEDVEIMRQVKTEKLNGEALLANGLISCRMYHGYREAINGFSKNFLAAFNYNIFAFLVYILIIMGGPFIILMTLNLNLIGLMCALIWLSRSMISLSSGQSVWRNLLLHPVQMLSLMLVGFLSIQRYLTKTTVWKGRGV